MGLVLLPLAADEAAKNAESGGAIPGITTGIKLGLTATTKGEAMTELVEETRIPLLAGTGPLTSGNNVKFRLGAALSPVSANGSFEAVLTPAAFVELVAGASIGSGWNLPLADGLRTNERTGAHDQKLSGDALAGAVWSVKGGAALQADLAAFRPGDWNHAVFRTYHAFRYRALTSAAADESWLYEADEGENRNGWVYYGNWFLGYRMPIRLDMVGLLVEEEQNLYDTAGGAYWGDDVTRWTFGVLANCALTDRISATMMAQARTERNFLGDTGAYAFYQDRAIDADDERSIGFYRLTGSVSFKLK